MKNKIEIAQLSTKKAIDSLLHFTYKHHMKAGLDIIRWLGDNSLKEKRYLTEDFHTESIIPGVSMLYNPCDILRRKEQEYDITVAELRIEIEERRKLISIKPLLNQLKEELIDANAHGLCLEALIQSTKNPTANILPYQVKLMDMQAALLGPVIYDQLLKAEDIDQDHLKQYADYVNMQYLKLMQLCYDMLNKKDDERTVAGKNSYKNEKTLHKMFLEHELLIKICDQLVEKGYAEKVNEGEYRWAKKRTKTELAAFSEWLSENKDKLFVEKEDFDDGNHRGRALCNYFMIGILPDKENKHSYQQFQDGKITNKGITEFVFLNRLLR